MCSAIDDSTPGGLPRTVRAGESICPRPYGPYQVVSQHRSAFALGWTVDPGLTVDSEQKFGVHGAVPITASKTSVLRGVCGSCCTRFLEVLFNRLSSWTIAAKITPSSITHAIKTLAQNGCRRPAQVQRRRLRERRRHAAMPQLPEAGQGELLLLARLLQA